MAVVVERLNGMTILGTRRGPGLEPTRSAFLQTSAGPR